MSFSEKPDEDFSLEDMQDISEDLEERFKPFSKKVETCGSVRRKKPNPSDIDMAIISGEKDKIKKEVREEGWKKKEWGDKRATFVLDNGVEVNVWFTDEKRWGATYYHCTGPSGAEGDFRGNVKMASVAKRKGMKFGSNGLYDRKMDELIPTPTEDDLCEEVYNRTCEPPGER